MNVHDALTQAQARGLPRIDAQMVVLLSVERDTHDRAWLWSHDDSPLSDSQLTRFNALLERRLAGEPMAYLTGIQEFHGMALRVDARVLVPRADTETLLDWALEILEQRSQQAPTRPRVLDLGTGSGAIALGIRASHPPAEVHAVDASADALAVARANAHQLGLDVHLHHGNWFAPVAGQHFDLIVSNPPYIAEDDPHLPALAHEPRTALTAGPDGLDDLRHIVHTAPSHLQRGAWLLLEHGFDQAEAVRALLGQAGFTHICSRKDLAGIERCSGGQYPFGG
ncbi:MAG: peptide chain release factor N(5)-glutamine methyltransferase [Burkholderiaceae bacterium]